MSDLKKWEAIAITGSAPAPSGMVQLIVRDPEHNRVGTLSSSPGSPPTFSATYPEDELTRMIEAGNVSALSTALAVSAFDVGLHVSAALRNELGSLGYEVVWPEDMEVVELRGRPGHTVGAGSKARLDEIRMGWAMALKRGADARGRQYMELGPSSPDARKALDELERLARLARYCVDPSPSSGLLYELWLRIGLAQSRRAETINLQRSYEIAVQPHKREWVQFQQDIEDLAKLFDASARDQRRGEAKESVAKADAPRKDVLEAGLRAFWARRNQPFTPSPGSARLIPCAA